MPSHKYKKPKGRVLQVYREKELENLLKDALQSLFSSNGVKITPAKVRRLLKTIPDSAPGGNIVLIVEQFPLNSMQARGKFKGLVYQVVNKTGTQYARKFKKSKNPQTPSQQLQRGKYMPGVNDWNNLSKSQKEEYKKKAKRLGMTGYNLFMQPYLSTT